MIRRPPSSTLFPSPALFRSGRAAGGRSRRAGRRPRGPAGRGAGSSPASPVGQADTERNGGGDRKSTRLNSSHANISYAVFCLKKKKTDNQSSVLLNSPQLTR